jgi:hypothetical protein
MLILLALLACTCPQDCSEDSSAACPECQDTDACDTGPGLAPQPDEDYLSLYSPVVVRTVPQAGDQAVDPALDEIRVTFSADMMDQSWSWVQVSPSTYPESHGVEYVDARTNVLSVTLEPEHTYVVWLNYDPDYMSFMDTHGNRAVPYQLAFRTAAY